MAWTPKVGGLVDREHPTQIARALKQLGIELILAYSPQVRWRYERIFGTWQGRLPQEFRLRGITTVEATNEFLRKDWIPLHDASFSVEAEQAGTAFLPYTGTELEKIFSRQHDRVGDNDNTVRYRNRCLQIPQQTFRFSLARCKVLVCEHLDQTMTVHYGNHTLGRYDAASHPLALLVQRKLGRPVKRAGLMQADSNRDRKTEERKHQKRKTKAAYGNVQNPAGFHTFP